MRCRFNPWVRKIPWKREWQPTPVFFFPGESQGQRSLAGSVHRIAIELDKTYWLNNNNFLTNYISLIAGKIPRTEEPGRLQSIESQRVIHHWAQRHIDKNRLEEEVFNTDGTLFPGFGVKCMRAWVEWQEMTDEAGEVDPVKIVRDHECFANNLQTVIGYKSIQLETTV